MAQLLLGIDKQIEIAFLPDVPDCFSWMTVRDSMRFCGKMANISSKEASEKAEQYLDYVKLKEKDVKVASLSRGMKQKLGIAQLLMTKSNIFILDEPTSALEPEIKNDILELLVKLAKEKTVCVSSHMLNDLEQICDYIFIFENGNIVSQDTKENMLSRFSKNKLMIELKDNLNYDNIIHDIFLTLNDVSNMYHLSDNKFVIEFSNNNFMQMKVLDYFVKNKIDVISLYPYKISLEEIYMRKVYK